MKKDVEFLREWIEHGMPLRVDYSLPTDVLTALEGLGAPLRDGEGYDHRGYRKWNGDAVGPRPGYCLHCGGEVDAYGRRPRV